MGIYEVDRIDKSLRRSILENLKTGDIIFYRRSSSFTQAYLIVKSIGNGKIFGLTIGGQIEPTLERSFTSISIETLLDMDQLSKANFERI